MRFSIEAADKSIYEYICGIIQACTDSDQIPYSIPIFSEFTEYSEIVIAWDDDTPIGFIWNTDCELNEAFGMVVPDKRNQGIFKKLIEFLTNVTQNELTFYGKPQYSLMEECAGRFGYQRSITELLMVYAGKNCVLNPNDDMDYDEDENCFYYYVDDELIGRCSIFETDTSINIYEVFIWEEFRGKGYCKYLINNVINNIVNSGKKIILQVQDSNAPAVKSYTRCGFVIEDSIIYYTKISEKR